uniref:Beta-glucosidase 24 n=1 Tax=Anthurium amnicola TaxID=1678845 RepID=A0A1D1ZG17_9ARAE
MALVTIPLTMSPALPSLGNVVGKGAFPTSQAGRRRELGYGKRHAGGSLVVMRVKGPDAEGLNDTKVDSKLMLKRSSFPPDFMFGAASSAYQIEGAYNEGGRKPSIWDTFCHTYPERIKDHSNGDVAIDSYHRFKEDVKVLKEMGADVYRFSISWPRILPDGRGTPNPEGIAYYNKLIDELIANGITPFLTLFHWDVPQALEDEYGGFLDRKIVDDFKYYSQVCFEAFGNRVKHWITVNEPSSFTRSGYDTGKNAPGRCSDRKICTAGDSATEPYIVTHNLLLAHAECVKLYRDQYQAKQKGEIGITLVTQWMTPYSDSLKDRQARMRSLDFAYGWFIEPVVYGDYPFIMKAIVRERLPHFTKEESDMLRGSYDFIGINYYTARYAQDRPMPPNPVPISYSDDFHANLLEAKDGVPIGEPTGTWLYVYPQGIHDLLVYTKENYNNPKIYITENGTCEVDSDIPLKQALDDQHRIRYFREHLQEVHEAMRKGANVKGYLCWSLMDNFEWSNGYTMRFGMCYINYQDDLKRLPKASHEWFTNFLEE